MRKDIKIIDGDVHISTEPKDKAATGEEILELMDKYGIEKSLITLQCGIEMDEPCDYEGLNRYVYQQSQKYPDRFIPLGWINPRLWSLEECKKNIQTQKEEFGFKAAKLNGCENYFDLLDPVKSFSVVEELGKAGMMVAFHSGADERTTPKKVRAIAEKFPEITILLIHMGNSPQGSQDAIDAAVANKNIYFIGSVLEDYSYVRKAVDTIGSKRMCFGTDAPFFDQGECIKAYEEVLDGISDEGLANVMGQNILDLFGVK